MKLKFTRKTWYFFLLAAAAVSMLGGFAVLGGMDFSGLEMIVFCLTGIAVLFLAAQKGAPAREKRNYTGVFVVLMLSKLGASGWAGDICSALVWPALLATEYERGKPIQRQLQLVSAAEVLLMVVFSLLVVFPVMGRDYDAAMITAGFIGFGMGATSNAMANMQAVSRRYGPSPSAYFVIPMVGGLFNDFFNAAIIAFCIGLLA